ncbi:tetratricopeptide repeat protein [Nostoc commune]|uniref:tetratricopeptide repeat protein n=1 Tax=Nostoc commune TaxID=1178 RepID=UPI002073DA87|nr:tetratricopeptide repeat protein [Nostoc commune]
MSEQARRHLPFLGLFSEHINVSILPAFSEINEFSQVYQTIFGENLQKSDWFRILNEAAEAGILEQISETIYKIHPALPWYLRQQLSKQHTVQEVSNLEKKLLVFYGVLATVCGQKMISKADTATNVLLTEESNLLQNLRLAERQQEWDNARLMLSALGEIYQRQNHTMEFRALRQKIIKEIDTKFEQSNEAFKLWAYLQAADAEEAFENRDIRKASNVYQKISSELARLNYQDMNVEIAVVEQGLAKIAEEQQDFKTSRTHYIKAIKILESIQNIDQDACIENANKIANIYQNLGYMADKKGCYNVAKSYYEKALKIFINNRNIYGCAGIYNNLGKIEHLQSHFEKAHDYYKQALEIYQKVGDFNKSAIIYHNLGRMAQMQQDFKTAHTFYNKALRIHEDDRDLYNASDVYQGLGEISKYQGDFDSATAYFKKALEIRFTANDWQKVSLTLNTWGQTLEAQENWNDAMEIYIHAFAIDFRYNKSWIGSRIKNLARMLKQLGESQFDTIWQEVTSEDCPEVLREAIWSARDNL